jgi:protease PrsW
MRIEFLIGIFIAVVVPVLATYFIFKLDPFGTGKGSTVSVCLAWGALGAFGFAYIVNQLTVPLIGEARVDAISAPIIEEFLKLLILVYFIQMSQFRYVVDGAVYGFAVGVGFAITENLLYLSNHSDVALTLAISRVLSSSLMHATASATVGIHLDSFAVRAIHEF